MWEYTAAKLYLCECRQNYFKYQGKPIERGHRSLSTVDGTNYHLPDGLNALGKQGWELVAIDSTDNTCIFKRPLTG
jgi:hypothetical protein